MPLADSNASRRAGPVALSHLIERELDKILDSDTFATAASLRRLLHFVVHETIAGRGRDIKEYSLGVAVLGKEDAFDPKADPIVRVQMRRLREHLARYFDGDGRNDPLIIDIPKGRYMPTFRAGTEGAAAMPVDEEGTVRVGQAKEMAALTSAFEAAAAGKGRLLCLSGEPGIGKTTAVEAFLRELSASGAHCCIGRARCSERLVGTDAYLPVVEMLENVMRGGGERVRPLVIDLAPTWNRLIGPRVEGGQIDPGRPDAELASQERLKRELVAVLQALARECPVVLFFDDLHWADVSTVDALAYAAPRWTADRILTLGTFRPAELLAANQPFYRVKLELQGHGVCREIGMELLTRGDVARYLALQFPEHRFTSELAGRIHDRTEGNPLFMADLVRFLRDRGVLAQRDGQWAMVGQLSDVERDLPESVRSMVQKKIGELTEENRKLMSAAAVMGPEFDSAVLAEAVGSDATHVEERLSALDRSSGFVRQIGERLLPDSTPTLDYGFVHVLYQNALYEALTPMRKADLSLALGKALARAYGENASEVASRLALLFETGRDFARAADFCLLASQNAARMCATEQAVRLAQHAIANAERLDGAERHRRVVAAAMQSAGQHQSITRLDAALADFELADRAAQMLGDPVAQVHAIFGQAVVLFLSKRIAQTTECGRRAMQVAESSGSPGAVAASVAILAMAGLCEGEVTVAERQFDEAIPVLQQCGFIPHALVSVLLRGLLHTWRLEHDEAESALIWARKAAGELHATFESLVGLWHRARARANRGCLSDAQDMLEESLRLSELLGDRFWRPRIENTRGWLLGELFDTESALRLDTEAVQMAREFGDIEAECNSHINAARDYLTLGEPHNAWLHLQHAEARYQHDVWFRWVYYPRLQAELAGYWLAQGDLGQAAACARLSLQHAERTLCRKRIASARKLLGDIAMSDGRPQDAMREFTAALTLLERYPCPLIEWRVLHSAAAAAAAVGEETVGCALLGRAAAVVRSLAGSIRHPEVQASFLRSPQVRGLMKS